MQTAKGGMAAMILLGTLLVGFGLWQLGGAGVIGERGDEHEREEDGHEWRPIQSTEARIPDEQATEAAVSEIFERYGGRIYEMEREYENGREVLEVKLIDRDGRKREILLDPGAR
jgi:uncharacterized membrane protein YkoI